MKLTLVVNVEDEVSGFEEILQRVDSHTLILELIAKQISNSHITLSNAAALLLSTVFLPSLQKKLITKEIMTPREILLAIS